MGSDNKLTIKIRARLVNMQTLPVRSFQSVFMDILVRQLLLQIRFFFLRIRSKTCKHMLILLSFRDKQNMIENFDLTLFQYGNQ